MTGRTHDDDPASLESWLRDRAPIFYIVFDAAGAVIEANPFTRSLVGEGILAGGAGQIFVSFGRPLDIQALRSDPDTPHLLSVSTAAGLPESLRLSFRPSGDDTLVIGGVEIREVSRLRREMITLNNELAAMTREIQRKNRELAGLNKLKTQFLGMAAHDLRKPVGAILNFTEFLIDEAGEALDREHLGFLQTILRSTSSMKDLIDSFIDASLIEAGRFALEPRMSDVGDPARQSVELLRLSARKRGVELELELADGLPLISVDSPKIEQVLNNLISNAIEHSPEGSRVVVSVDRDDDGVRLEVRDAGPGIPAEEQAGLFELFRRGSARKSGGVRSIGLGLAISKKIVDAHGGRIELSSEPGTGSRFKVHLPRKQAGQATKTEELG